VISIPSFRTSIGSLHEISELVVAVKRLKLNTRKDIRILRNILRCIAHNLPSAPKPQQMRRTAAPDVQWSCSKVQWLGPENPTAGMSRGSAAQSFLQRTVMARPYLSA
ncbi:MAG: hypothetical protein IJI54_08915, partial [Kiritimatiellae bacterium]|nr:hypothetical protein [Kiritimatiellia bacterium]